MSKSITKQGFHEVNAEQIKEVMADFVPIFQKTKKEMSSEFAYMQSRFFIDEAVSKTKLMEKTSCFGSKCSFCCHDTIYVSHDEGDYIKKVIKDKGIIPNANRIALQKENNRTLKWEFKACPLLLDEDETGQRKCSIYEDRPLICRTHNSVDDPEFCNKEKHPGRTVGELKAVMIEGLIMSSMVAGNKNYSTPEDCLVSLHSIL